VGEKFYKGSFETPTMVHDGELVARQSGGKLVHWLSVLLEQDELQ
jgi:hypothetical protein